LVLKIIKILTHSLQEKEVYLPTKKKEREEKAKLKKRKFRNSKKVNPNRS